MRKSLAFRFLKILGQFEVMRSSLQTTLFKSTATLWEMTRNIPVFLTLGSWCGQRETVLLYLSRVAMLLKNCPLPITELVGIQRQASSWNTKLLRTMTLYWGLCQPCWNFLRTPLMSDTFLNSFLLTLRGHTCSQSLGSLSSSRFLSFTPISISTPQISNAISGTAPQRTWTNTLGDLPSPSFLWPRVAPRDMRWWTL